ncbi:hypothetical protein CSH63_32335 [Micromonospora tulbaghiae]|uniref:Recombinase RecT n=1 Tax=Micromonospora tulbaghiae TaxID=479978 RepID=A0A386WUB6_9ACTN|nr:recombinase RecT [Micromonospora tulbaghiae]AYF32045.1 hypothetical protein CSH63_32335 [Micromonospora tulbaghiae]
MPDEATKTAGTDVAVKKKGTLSDFIASYEGDFAAVVPRHVNVEAFVGLAAAYVRRDQYLRAAASANPASLILALRECAALGHVPTPKVFALTAFNDRHAPGGKRIVGIETYHGVIERMFRGGGVQAVHVEVGREHDPVLRFNSTRDRLPVHEYDEFAAPEDRGPLKAVYAWATLMGGATSQVIWLNRHDVARIRAMSKSINPRNGPPGGNFWGPPWPDEGPNTVPMWKKSALHRLETFVPTSAEYRWQVASSEAGASRGFTGIPDRPVREFGPSPDDVVDAELIDDPTGPADPGGPDWSDVETRQPGSGAPA